MAGVLVKNNTVAYDYERIVKGQSFIRIYNAKGFCFMQFSDISEVGFTAFKIYRLTEDTSSVSGKKYYIRNGNTFTQSSFVKGCYEEDKYEVASVAGVGAVAADVVGNVGADKKLTVKLPAGIYTQDALQVSFKAPCTNASVSTLVIDGEEFALVSADGTCVDKYLSGFKKDDIVTVILDLTAPKSAVVRGYTFGGKAQVSDTMPTDESVDIWINPSGGFGSDIDDKVEADSKNLITSGAVYEYVNAMIAKLKEELSN